MHQPTKSCNHILPASASTPTHPCGSPALRGESFCYYHHPTRRPRSRYQHFSCQARQARAAARKSFTLPHSDTRTRLQKSLAQVACRIATNQIDLRRAGLLLQTLQQAARNLKSPVESHQLQGAQPHRRVAHPR